MARTVVEKIVQAHAEGLPAGREVRAGDYVTLVPDHVMTHDNTSAVLAKFRGLGAGRIHDPRQPVFTLDHNIQDTGEANLAKYRAIEAFAREQGVVFFPAGSGIGHQIMVEQGFVHPGALVVASDSHSNMYGALGALGTPVVRTDAAAIWATGRTWWQVPPTVKVTLTGALSGGATGKDVIITLCGLYNRGEVLNAAVEFGGPGVATLPVEERLAIANMTTEWGALVGWFPVDGTSLDWLGSRAAALRAAGFGDRITDDDLARWADDPPRPDPDAAYAAEIVLDLSRVTPHVSGPDTVQTMTSLAEMAPRRLAIQKAYLVSCVNSRQPDLAAAARVLRGRKVAPGVSLYVAAASRQVQRDAEAAGDWQALIDAGAVPLPPGCGPCIGLGTGLLEPGEVGISATNRNFKGRMGSRDARCYLASPAVVAASAAAGHITGPPGTAATAGAPDRDHRVLETPARDAAETTLVDGFPSRIRGRALLVPADNLNTDGIYGKDYTYRDDVTREEMARVVMQNYDPAFAGTVRAGDVLVAGRNFGTGSSREQAATALAAAGIPLVIAGSYSQTYLRNAFNNGFPCVECPALVDAMRAALADRAAGARTIVCDDPVEVDFAASRIRWRDGTYPFPPLGPSVQELVVAGGVENQVRRRIGEA